MIQFKYECSDNIFESIRDENSHGDGDNLLLAAQQTVRT